MVPDRAGKTNKMGNVAIISEVLGPAWTLFRLCVTPIQKRKKRYKVLGQNLIKPRQHSCSIVKVLNSASEMKILQDVTDLWTMNITFYKEKLNPLSSLMTGATYWCKKQTAIVLVSDRQRNAASQKLSSPMILALYFIHVWTGVGSGKIQDIFQIFSNVY